MPIARPGKPSTLLSMSARSYAAPRPAALATLLWFKLVSAYEGVHPLEGGAFRRKFRRDRRDGLPRENPVLFYPRYLAESAVKMWRYWSVYRQCKSILDEVLAAPNRWTYTDLAIAPPRDDEFEALDLYHATAGGEAALARMHRDDAIRKSAHAAIWQAPATSTAVER